MNALNLNTIFFHTRPMVFLEGLAFCLLVGLSQAAYGQSDAFQSQAIENREVLQRDLISHMKTNQTIMSSAPVTHIIPQRNTYVVAGSFSNIDMTVTPRDQKLDSDDLKEKLEYKGVTAAPLIAKSWKKFAVGLTYEHGTRSIYYETKEGYTIEESSEGIFTSSATNYQVYSELEYGGPGGYLYFIPEGRFLPKGVTSSINAGLVQMSAKHKTNGGQLGNDKTEGDFESSSYTVVRNQVGANMNIRIGSRFYLIYWFNYVTHKIDNKSFSEQINQDRQFAIAPTAYEQVLTHDEDLVFRSTPRQSLGVDMSLRLGKLEINLAGLLSLVNVGQTPNYITDKSTNLSASISF